MNTLVAEAIDVVIHCARTKTGLRVTEIICVEDFAGGPEAAQFTVTEVFARPRHDLPLAWTGNLPVRAARALREAGHDVRALLGTSRWDGTGDAVDLTVSVEGVR